MSTFFAVALAVGGLSTHVPHGREVARKHNEGVHSPPRLELSIISVAHSNSTGGSRSALRCEIQFRNPGPDVKLFIGQHIGYRSFPDKVFLRARDASGRVILLYVADIPVGVTGTFGWWQVPMPRGAEYFATWSWAAGEALPPGQYTVVAQFAGENVWHQQGYWLGKLESAPVNFTVPDPKAP
jgi:hypothetical protein